MAQRLRLNFKQPFSKQTRFEKVTVAGLEHPVSVIRNVSAMQADVEALGHGCMTDLKALHMLAEMGNKAVAKYQARGAKLPGLKTRFGHPGISSSALGTHVANGRNFRVENGKLLQDDYFLRSAEVSPHGNLTEYLSRYLNESSEHFGKSVVIWADRAWVLNDGTERTVEYDEEWGGYANRPDDDELQYELPVIRPTSFEACDYVDEPAANRDGVFSQLSSLFSGTSPLSQEVFQAIDSVLEENNLPPVKVVDTVTAYLAWRGHSAEATQVRGLRQLARQAMDEELLNEEVAQPDTFDAVMDQLEEDVTTGDDELEVIDTEARLAQLEAGLQSALNQLAQAQAQIEALEERNAVLERNDGRIAQMMRSVNERFGAKYDGLFRHYQALNRQVRMSAGQIVRNEQVTTPQGSEELDAALAELESFDTGADTVSSHRPKAAFSAGAGRTQRGVTVPTDGTSQIERVANGMSEKQRRDAGIALRALK